MQRRRSNKDMRYWKMWPASLVFSTSFADSYCLCDLLHDRKLKTFSVVMVKQMLKYFAIPYGSRNRKTTQVTELLTLLEGCDCH